MSLRADVLRGIQTPQILHLPPDVHSLDAATEAIELAESVGLELDEAQQIAINAALGERRDGSFAAGDVGHVVARQNGKGEVMIARQLWGLFVAGEELQIATAHEFPTANEAFLRLVAYIEGADDLRSRVARIRYANGEQGVELLNGNRLKYRARTGGSGRGFAGVSCIYYDEAMYLTDAHMAASGPAGITKGDRRQNWFASSAGLSTSSVLWRLRRRALSGSGGRLAYVEHTAESVSLDPSGRVVSVRPDPDDRQNWAAANPTLGDRIQVEAVQDERDSYSPDVFLRERLSVWDPEVGSEESVWPADVWAAAVSEGAAPVGQLAMGVEASADRRSATIAVAGGGVVELVVDAQGRRVPQDFGSVEAEVVRIARAHRATVAIDPAGHAGFLIPALEAAGVPFLKVNGQSMGQAVGSLFVAVNERKVTIRKNAELDVVVNGARRVARGDVWVWDRRPGGAVDVSPLVAVTLAWWAAQQSPVPAGGVFVDWDSLG